VQVTAFAEAAVALLSSRLPFRATGRFLATPPAVAPTPAGHAAVQDGLTNAEQVFNAAAETLMAQTTLDTDA
jgi:hypothetical protein